MTRTYAQPATAENAGRRYPLLDDVETGIPDDAVLDCHVVTTRAVDPTRASIAEIAGDHGADTVKIVLDVDGSGVTIHATPGRLSSGTSEDGSATAWIVVGDSARTLSFTGNARLAPTVVACDARRVRSIRSMTSSLRSEDVHVHGGSATDARLSGSVSLVPGYNVDAVLIDGRIRLHVANGGGIGAYCRAVAGNQTCGGVMYSINGELPDENGNMVIKGGSGVTVTRGGENEIVVGIAESVFSVLSENCN